MADFLNSTVAVMDCMDQNGLTRNDDPSYTVQAYFFNERKPQIAGSIQVTFYSGQYGNDLTVETTDVIKGYKVPFTSFNPNHQTFEFNQEENRLKITGDGYCFTLSQFEKL